jgi:4-hydroxybenzoate polyprenyltransferase
LLDNSQRGKDLSVTVKVNPHSQLMHYVKLMRLDKPIGILLLLWPTLWALWLASHGQPDNKILFIFVAGVILMRSAGCILNDLADRNFDGRVARTRDRPLTQGYIDTKNALLLAMVLSGVAFLLVLFCNPLTIALAVIGALITLIYPFMKRYTHLPQLGLGIAFAWGIPMAFAAVRQSINAPAWILFVMCVVWPVIYDTLYAMVDRADDLKIGIKSSAILFAQMDRIIIALLQLLFVLLLVIVGLIFHLKVIYYISIVITAVLFLYQQWLVKTRDPQQCFAAFLNNNWVGLAIFVGISMSFL